MQPDSGRALHGLARSLGGRNKLKEALEAAQAALNQDPRDAEFHHTVGSIYERMLRYDEAANAYSSYINLLPNKDRSSKAAWARAEVRFLRAFGDKLPLQIDPASDGKLHTVPFRIINEKIIVKAKVNRGPQMDFVLDTGSEQTVISRETAARMGIRPIVNMLSAGVGDLGVRELELTRLDQLEIGSLKVHNVPAIIKNPPLHGLPTREMESFSPLALGMSVIIDYDRLVLVMGSSLPVETADVELPLRMHRLAMVPGHVQGGPASFILDTGGQVISISTDTASGLERGEMRNIPLKVYGASGWDRDAFLMPGVEPELQQDRVPQPLGGRPEPARAERAARLPARRHRRVQVPQPLSRGDQPRQEHRPAAGARDEADELGSRVREFRIPNSEPESTDLDLARRSRCSARRVCAASCIVAPRRSPEPAAGIFARTPSRSSVTNVRYARLVI